MTFDPDYREKQDLNPPTTVVNIRNEEYDVYIGRAGKGQDGYFGNNHPVYQISKSWTECPICHCKHTRDEAITAFKKDFDTRINNDVEFKQKVLSLRGKRLGCFCSPLNCHGAIYKNWLDNNLNIK
jgi:hypothetical protein